MSTGFTYPVETGEMTELADFIRSFVPRLGTENEAHERFENSTRRTERHLDDIKQAKRKLALAQKWSDATADKKAAAEFRRDTKYHTERLIQQNLVWFRYNEMLRKVEAWVLLTRKHQALKDLMIEQLTTSIEHACRFPVTPPVRLTGAEYRQQEIEYRERAIAFIESDLVKDQKKASDEFHFVLTLLENLRQLEAQE
jgi:hypothetical protein